MRGCVWPRCRWGELFSGRAVYSMPGFQRRFDWGPDEAIQLLDDILRAAAIDTAEDDRDSADPDYFLGTLLLLTNPGNPLPGSRGDDAGGLIGYEIIDGQQRLTTLTVLFAVLRDLGATTDRKVAPLIEILEAEARNSPLPSYRIQLNGRDRHLFRRFVQKHGGTLIQPDDLADEVCIASCKLLAVREALLVALRQYEPAQRIALLKYLVEKCHVVVTLSHDRERAHRLFTVLNERGKPLRGNDIIKVELLGSLATSEREYASEKWDEIERLLDDSFEVFFGHLRAVKGRRRGSMVDGLRSMIREAGGARVFVDDVLLPYAHIYARMRSCRRGPLPVGDPLSLHLHYLWRLRGEEWVPAVLVALKTYADAPEVELALVRAIDRIAHITRILCEGSGRRTTLFGQVVKAIDSGEAKDGSAKVFSISREKVRNIKFHLRDLYRRNQPICKLVLLRINDHISQTVTLVDPAVLSVEHVLPHRPSVTSGWRVLFADPEIREAATQSLGNLTLLPEKLNDRIRNRDFADKREHIVTHFGDADLLGVVSDVVSAEAWDRVVIAAREARFLDALSEIIGIDVRDAAVGQRSDAMDAAE